MSEGLVYIGRIVDLQPIYAADLIVCATVVCGEGGKWQGVVRKQDFVINDSCVVFLPDALIPEREDMAFMKHTGWRVKMRRFKGAPSEVVIMPIAPREFMIKPVGTDLTEAFGVTKYHKPVPENLQGIAKGMFPDFIPKTDEPNYQRYPELVEKLCGNAWYMTEKADGASTTAFKHKGVFGLCSRNLELERNEDNGYWKVALKYDLENKLSEGLAIQFETCGPGIQGNPMGLQDIDGFLFSGYSIIAKRYLTFHELRFLCLELNMPTVRFIEWGCCFFKDALETRGEGVYKNGKQREGVVIRSQENMGHVPISFKVINLNYEK